MPFAIFALDRPDAGTMRADNRPAHLEHLDRHAAKLLAGGAVFADDGATPVGSLIVFDSEDRAEVEAFVAGDPFTQGRPVRLGVHLPLAQGVLRRGTPDVTRLLL